MDASDSGDRPWRRPPGLRGLHQQLPFSKASLHIQLRAIDVAARRDKERHPVRAPERAVTRPFMHRNGSGELAIRMKYLNAVRRHIEVTLFIGANPAGDAIDFCGENSLVRSVA